jgi:hypothetical protein
MLEYKETEQLRKKVKRERNNGTNQEIEKINKQTKKGIKKKLGVNQINGMYEEESELAIPAYSQPKSEQT